MDGAENITPFHPQTEDRVNSRFFEQMSGKSDGFKSHVFFVQDVGLRLETTRAHAITTYFLDYRQGHLANLLPLKDAFTATITPNGINIEDNPVTEIVEPDAGTREWATQELKRLVEANNPFGTPLAPPTQDQS